MSAERFLGKSAFLLSRGARTTPLSSLDSSKITPALVSFDSLSVIGNEIPSMDEPDTWFVRRHKKSEDC